MLKVKFINKGFEMEGHCGYAPHGSDIVCAAVSTLYMTFLMCTECTEDINGNTKTAYIVGDNPDDIVIYNAIKKGVERIATEYPNFVKIVG